jgi:hypothetical protein
LAPLAAVTVGTALVVATGLALIVRRRGGIRRPA